MDYNRGDGYQPKGKVDPSNPPKASGVQEPYPSEEQYEEIYSDIIAIHDQFFEQSEEIAKLKFINQKISRDLEIQVKVNNMICNIVFCIHRSTESIAGRHNVDDLLADLKSFLNSQNTNTV
jgi:hypothetical protein